jgi:hypothetical protein
VCDRKRQHVSRKLQRGSAEGHQGPRRVLVEQVEHKPPEQWAVGGVNAFAVTREPVLGTRQDPLDAVVAEIVDRDNVNGA